MAKTNLKAVTQDPQRSAEREALAEAHAKRDEAVANANKLRAAADPLKYGMDAFRRVDAAEAALKEAESKATALTTARILGERPEPGVLTVREAREALQLAKEEYEALRAAKPSVDAALAEAVQAESDAKWRVEQKARAVVAADPATSALFDCLAVTSPRYLGVSKVIDYLDARSSLPTEHKRRAEIDHYKGGDGYVTKWQEALRALEHDADSELPALP